MVFNRRNITVKPNVLSVSLNATVRSLALSTTYNTITESTHFVNRVSIYLYIYLSISLSGVRCSSVVKAFANGAMGRRIDPS